MNIYETIHLPLSSIVVSKQLSLLFANASPERLMVPALLDIGLLRINDNLARHVRFLTRRRSENPDKPFAPA